MKTAITISTAQLAKELGISFQAVNKWDRVPADRVLDVARACDWLVTPHQIRPDLYPNPTDAMPVKRRRKQQEATEE